MTFRKDIRGRDLQPGVQVAYNISGQIAKGQLLHAGRGGYGPYKVRLLHDAAGKHRGHISNVRNARSLMVIHEATA